MTYKEEQGMRIVKFFDESEHSRQCGLSEFLDWNFDQIGEDLRSMGGSGYL